MSSKLLSTGQALLVIAAGLAVLPARAADPQPFAPVAFGLASSPTRPETLPFAPAPPASPAELTSSSSSVFGNLYVPLPVGPVRIDFGESIVAAGSGFHYLDAPGPGYQRQKANVLGR